MEYTTAKIVIEKLADFFPAKKFYNVTDAPILIFPLIWSNTGGANVVLVTDNIDHISYFAETQKSQQKDVKCILRNGNNAMAICDITDLKSKVYIEKTFFGTTKDLECCVCLTECQRNEQRSLQMFCEQCGSYVCITCMPQMKIDIHDDNIHWSCPICKHKKIIPLISEQ